MNESYSEILNAAFHIALVLRKVDLHLYIVTEISINID